MWAKQKVEVGMSLTELKAFAAKVRADADDSAAVAKLTDKARRDNPNDAAVKALCDQYANAADGDAVRAICDEVAAR